MLSFTDGAVQLVLVYLSNNCLKADVVEKLKAILNPILHGFWHDVIIRVWAIIAHTDFRGHNFAKRPI